MCTSSSEVFPSDELVYMLVGRVSFRRAGIETSSPGGGIFPVDSSAGPLTTSGPRCGNCPGRCPIRVLQRALVVGNAISIWIAVHCDDQHEFVLGFALTRSLLSYNTQTNPDSQRQLICTSKFETQTRDEGSSRVERPMSS
ncbi:Crossover junction endonuclease mus81 [Puccinia graminis f. sp. tritici]|uniref:Crossover junction endonuclease mus81 n=1 Tax=Puccinia graminis f. sp. tritici TaxID=56615 RepID=A0A5B0P2R9_PUCGR|nr:Crossover junction endonuclease mus81 [Puccinia graminis f. sp. tritici]